MNNNMGLQSLLNEPQRLALESEKLNIELDSLVLDHYRIFIENLTCSVHLRAEVSSFQLDFFTFSEFGFFTDRIKT